MQVNKVPKVKLDLQENKVPKEMQVNKVPKVKLDLQENKVPKEIREMQVR